MVNRILLLMLLLILVLILLVQSTLPAEVKFLLEGDLDGDGLLETYSLIDDQILVTEVMNPSEAATRDTVIELWSSPREYRIDTFALGDIDNDGTTNLVMSLWKRGSFGAMTPFWHTDKDDSYKNHLFIYKLEDDTFKQVWCSSDLDCPILSFTIEDADGNGLNELLVTEGGYKKLWGSTYAVDPHSPLDTSLRYWDEWGFRLLESKY